MSENILNQILNDETDFEDFLRWLTRLNYEDPECAQLSSGYGCSKADFATYFLNFVHEDVGSGIDEKRAEQEDAKGGNEIGRSHGFPRDPSSEAEDDFANSTPKVSKVHADSSVFATPLSPIYAQNHSFTTPKGPKSSLCLGDFITNKRVSSKKKSSEGKRRIKPTNLTHNKVNSFCESENSFNFNDNAVGDFPSERDFLVTERLKILSRKHLISSGSKKCSKLLSDEIRPDPDLVTYKSQIDKIVVIYTHLLNDNFVLNLTSEIYFLITLLQKRQFYSVDYGIDVLNDRLTTCQLFNTIHNVVYFACQTLQSQIRVLRNYDNSTVRLLSENDRLRRFAPILIDDLRKVCKPDRITEFESCQSNICFNSDTDNRQNFPHDPSFHAFRKQRDLFYEVLRIWERHHLAPGFNFAVGLGGKIKTLLSLSSEPTNFVHFARLFKAQLLNACRNGDSADFVTSLEVDAQKLSKLKSRLVTKGTCQGLNSLPAFNEEEEFYKDFVVVGANFAFNRHLADAIIEEITDLNESSFGSNELEEETNADVDFIAKKQYYACIKSLRILAKFLGFVESLPYKTDSNSHSEHLLTTHLRIRQQIRPNFDVKALLENAIRRHSIILCVPWLVKYLSMLDYITLKLPYYNQVHSNLFWIYRNFKHFPDPNIYLVKFCLGWFFELPNVPDNDYLHFCMEMAASSEENPKPNLDHMEIIDQDILYFCCPYLDEIKKLLSSNVASHSIRIKHITPVTAPQSPDEVARKKLEQQLEDAFLNGQPLSIRKTVEFVSERIASTCVKHVCGNLVPSYKRTAVEKFRSAIADEGKLDVKARAQEFAAVCLEELREICRDESEKIAREKSRQAVESLVGSDVLPQTKRVCVRITEKACLERVKQWIGSHVTLSVFTKDLNDEIQKISGGEERRQKKPTFMLPPGGNRLEHNPDTTSAAHLLEDYRDFTLRIVERKGATKQAVISLIDDTSRSIEGRGDFNQCILATICTQLLDLTVVLLSHHPEIVFQDGVLSKSCDIWRLYFNGCDDLFKSLLCPRNVRILDQSNDRKASWGAFARFCVFLSRESLLTSEVFESQCAGIFRCNWEQDTLKLITDFFKTFLAVYKEQGGSASDFTFLLGFFSDFCEDLF